MSTQHPVRKKRNHAVLSNTSLDPFQPDTTSGCLSSKQQRRQASRLALHAHQNNVPTDPHCSYTYIDSWDCSYTCGHCGARFWYDERVKSSSTTRNFIYNQCCRGGRVRLELSPEPPDIIKQLYQRSDFLDNIRAYNSMFATTSFGAHVDNSINTGSAPYVFRVEGQICHWIGTLCPAPNDKPRFLQMYIYDTQHELSNRLALFEGNSRSQFDEDIVRLLISFLENFNEIVKVFRSARDLCLMSDVPNFAIRLYHSAKQIPYDSPSPNTIGAIIYESVPGANDFDIIIYSKEGNPKRINKLDPLYMALQYPLLFLYGERGWSPELQLITTSNERERNLTANMFYSYLLHDRLGVYSLLLRGGG